MASNPLPFGAGLTLRSTTLSFVTLVLLLLCVASTLAQTVYQPNWDSLNSRPLPAWYDQAKFGVFIHWGVYSVPAWGPIDTYAEWYWWNLAQGPGNPTYEFHVKTYGENFNYQDFAPMFKAELFNATYWAQLIVQSGAKYVVPTSKHHEGFTLWPSAQSWNWNAMDVGPEQDLLGELLNATKAAGLYSGFYYSLFEWFNPLYTGPDPHIYVDQIMLPQLYDAVNRYQPDIIWADGEWEHTSEFWNSTEFLAWLYNDSPVKDTVIVNDRWGSECRGVDGGFFTAEYSSEYWLNHKWEENSGIDHFSYGLNRNSQAVNYFTTQQLLYLLIRTVSLGGNLLLDVGPRDDGSIIPLEEERLLQMGQWLSVNGPAIYGSSPWRVQNETEASVFYTQNTASSSVYVIATAWPTNSTLVLQSPIASASTTVSFLGLSNTEIKFDYKSGAPGMTIYFPMITPTEIPCQYAWTFQLNNVQ